MGPADDLEEGGGGGGIGGGTGVPLFFEELLPPSHLMQGRALVVTHVFPSFAQNSFPLRRQASGSHVPAVVCFSNRQAPLHPSPLRNRHIDLSAQQVSGGVSTKIPPQPQSVPSSHCEPSSHSSPRSF